MRSLFSRLLSYSSSPRLNNISRVAFSDYQGKSVFIISETSRISKGYRNFASMKRLSSEALGDGATSDPPTGKGSKRASVVKGDKAKEKPAVAKKSDEKTSAPEPSAASKQTKKAPSDSSSQNRLDKLKEILETQSPDILCIQETKLQTSEEFKNQIQGYHSFWVESTVKKGYSGVAIFVKNSIANRSDSSAGSEGGLSSFGFTKKGSKSGGAKENVSAAGSDDVFIKSVKYEFDDKRFSGEGRAITIDMNLFYAVGCYVPNSGQNLERLDYRVDEWDPFILQYLNSLKAIKPVVYFGDLNVGHLDLDIHNPTAKHITTQAGLTPRERNSMTKFLSSGFSDAFRFLYPNAKGNFTYWSQRAGNRPYNKGIRLDYFIVSDNMLGETLESSSDSGSSVTLSKVPTPGVIDSFICHKETEGVSDHCPVALIIKV